MSEPDRLYLPRVLAPEDVSELVGTTVPDSVAFAHPITSPTVIHDAETGEAVLAYLPLADAGELRRAVLRVDASSGVQRNSHYRSRSRTFGYAPRRVVTRREGCMITALGVDHPDIEATLERYADQFSATLEMIDRAILPRDRETLAEVRSDWRMGSAELWTSGVINDTAALPYHRDGFNFPTWSAMPVVRRGVRGGALALPEYDAVVGCADSTVVYFPGYRYVHGVTPLSKRTPDGYRISVVYYALKGMKDCRTYAEETRLAQQRRTEREAAMAQRLAAGDRDIPGFRGGGLDRLRTVQAGSGAKDGWAGKSTDTPPNGPDRRPGAQR